MTTYKILTGKQVKIFFFLIVFSFLPLSAVLGEGKISLGASFGYQYDAGNISGRTGVDGDAQQNASMGCILKMDGDMIFMRTGAEYSYPVAKGKINGSGDVTSTDISFIEVPVYAGLNLTVRDYGSLYMGGGGSYIFSFGNIDTLSGKQSGGAQLFGFGFITGIEAEISSDVSFLAEWEYMAARSSPLASTGGVYDDFYIDFTGSRFRFGAVCHINRY